MIHSNALVFLPATRNRPPPKLCLSLLKPAPKIQFMPPCLHVLPCLLVSLFFLGCASYGVCSLEYSVCRYGMEHGIWSMEYGGLQLTPPLSTIFFCYFCIPIGPNPAIPAHSPRQADAVSSPRPSIFQVLTSRPASGCPEKGQKKRAWSVRDLASSLIPPHN
jgi:hypothetical protein